MAEINRQDEISINLRVPLHNYKINVSINGIFYMKTTLSLLMFFIMVVFLVY